VRMFLENKARTQPRLRERLDQLRGITHEAFRLHEESALLASIRPGMVPLRVSREHGANCLRFDFAQGLEFVERWKPPGPPILLAGGEAVYERTWKISGIYRA